MANECLVMITKAHYEDGYQVGKNNQSPHKGKSVHNRCKINAVQEEDINIGMVDSLHSMCLWIIINQDLCGVLINHK